MMPICRRSWSLSSLLLLLAVMLSHGCSMGTEVGNGNRPRPSDESPEPATKSPSNDTLSNGSTESSQADTGANNKGDNSPVPTSAPARTSPTLPNPADANCLAKGGRLEPKKDAQGNEYALCHLPGGVTCESWAYFRGECPGGR